MANGLRIATWNVCWFSNLFDDESALRDDLGRSAMHNVTRQRQAAAIAHVLREVDADLWVIVEAPDQGRKRSTDVALSAFSAAFDLRLKKSLVGFPSETEQEIALWYDPAMMAAAHAPRGVELAEADALTGKMPEIAPRFDSYYPLDLDGDGQIDVHRFSKPPIEAVVEFKPSQAVFRIIGVHAKSKAPHSARDEVDAARISLLNRRKQLAQCAWLRARLLEHMQAEEPVIAMGDFNDGPGLDRYERVFGRSGVEVVIGDAGAPETQMRTPFVRRRLPSQSRPSTARFYNKATAGFLNALLDFVMLSPDLFVRTQPRWRIWHPFDDEACFEDQTMRTALLDASDHFPVSVDLSFT